MSLSSHLGGRPAPRAHTQFRIFVGIIAVAIVVLLVLQYTAYRFLPDGKTSTLWGVIVGVVGMTAVLEYLWRRE